MITIFIKATNSHNLNDTIRSLVGNSEKKDVFRIFVGGDKSFSGVVDSFKAAVEIKLLEENETVEYDSKLVWLLSDEVLVMGYQWDKRLLHYADKFPDDIIVMFPSGNKGYGARSETEIAAMSEKNPVVSAKWAELVGLQDAEMICRKLFLKYDIDRRIDARCVGVLERGAPGVRDTYDAREVGRKADIIADYIKNFTPGGT